MDLISHLGRKQFHVQIVDKPIMCFVLQIHSSMQPTPIRFRPVSPPPHLNLAI